MQRNLPLLGKRVAAGASAAAGVAAPGSTAHADARAPDQLKIAEEWQLVDDVHVGERAKAKLQESARPLTEDELADGQRQVLALLTGDGSDSESSETSSAIVGCERVMRRTLLADDEQVASFLEMTRHVASDENVQRAVMNNSHWSAWFHPPAKAAAPTLPADSEAGERHAEPRVSLDLFPRLMAHLADAKQGEGGSGGTAFEDVLREAARGLRDALDSTKRLFRRAMDFLASLDPAAKTREWALAAGKPSGAAGGEPEGEDAPSAILSAVIAFASIVIALALLKRSGISLRKW